MKTEQLNRANKDKTRNKPLSSDYRLVFNKYQRMCRYMSCISSADCSYSLLFGISKMLIFFTYNINQDSSNTQTKDEPEPKPNNLIIAYYIEALHYPVNSPREHCPANR